MKKIYIYDIGDVVDDLECISIEPSVKGSGKNCRYIMKCRICGREKSMIGACVNEHKGTTHKACGKGLKTKDKKFHSIWCSMRTRTNNPKYEHWKDYGDRGINSDEFKYFIDFYDAMYESYLKACKKYGKKNVSLERIDVDGNYSKKNCKWIHVSDQKGNQRNTIYFELIYPDGKIVRGKNPRKYAKEHDLCYSTLVGLIKGRIKTYHGIQGRRINRDEV